MAQIFIDGTSLSTKRIYLHGENINPLQPTTVIENGISIPNPWQHSYLPKGVLLPKDNYENNGIKEFDLPEGKYKIITSVHTLVKFEVTHGKVLYDASLNSCVSGNMSDKLILKGFKINIDARYIGGRGLNFEDTFMNSYTGYLLPNDIAIGHYDFIAESGIVADFGFDIDLSGNVHVLDSEHKKISTCNTNNLVVMGFPVLIDGHAVVLFRDANPAFSMADNHNLSSKTNVILANFMPLLLDVTKMVYLLKQDGGENLGFHINKHGIVTCTRGFKPNTYQDMRRVEAV
jgi:hypothetical protein